MLGRTVPYDSDMAGAVAAFNVAHNWRAAHAYPLMRERIRLTTISKGLTAGRIKRMDSIRKKLRRSPISLDRMQDLAGIRAILPTMEDVNRVRRRYSEDLRTSDYVAEPKPGGYRSIHLIKPFDEAGAGAMYRGQKVEIQLRTHLQHVWATAVEAIGNMRGEDLKAGEGNRGWLRLLTLMSGVIAEREGLPQGADVPMDQAERNAELRDLCHSLSAIAALTSFRSVVRETESRSGSGFYLVQMNAETGEVTVSAQSSFRMGESSYNSMVDSGERQQSILVAVDSMAALRAAYPNYFLDVATFIELLADATNINMGLTAPIPTSAIDRLSLDFLKAWKR
ncbi:hypothetical protein BV394_02125 [Brevirhabdus pacifica]|uniref:RelA/SpoT domain-containing protein n=2 Tax=Brevirhabdus pacifica TaxID=1267768 RepID=A0A1U7DFA4_9RHOB|nr:hypothetical protein BV394_02125 [Brevirhabdus pacifica]